MDCCELIEWLLSGAWVAVFLAFLVLMKKYRATFFSLQTGNEFFQNNFLKTGNSDDARARIVTRNRHLWQSIRPQVREWLKENWSRWVEEDPEWFNHVWICHVDYDLLPPEVLEQQNLVGGEELLSPGSPRGKQSRLSRAYTILSPRARPHRSPRSPFASC